MSEQPPEKRPPAAKRPRWKKKRWWFLLSFVALFVWFDGPGWRWLGQRVAAHYLPDLGYEVDFTLEGRLTSGPVRVTELQLSSEGVVHEVHLEGFEVRYSLFEAIKGQVEAIQVSGLHADVDLAELPDKEEETEEEDDKPPFDLEKTLADIRERLIPVDMDIREVSVLIRRGEEQVFNLEPTGIQHRTGSDEFVLDLGTMTLPGERLIPAQEPYITWQPATLSINHLRLLEEVSLSEVSATLSSPQHYAGRLQIGPTEFVVSTDLTTVHVAQEGAALTMADVERIADVELPLTGQLQRFNATITDFEEGLDSISAKLDLSLGDVNYDDWTTESATLKARLSGDTATVQLAALPQGSPLTLDASATLDRSNNFQPSSAEAKLTLTAMESILSSVRDRFTPGDNRPSPPSGSLTLEASSLFDESGLTTAEATLDITPLSEAPALKLDAQFKNEEGITAALALSQLELNGRFDPEQLHYEGQASLASFIPEDLDPWLLPFGIEVPRDMEASLTWSGRGEINEGTHQGALEIEQFRWQNGDAETMPEIVVDGRAQYAWPESVTLEGIHLQSGDQRFEIQAQLLDETLRVDEILWAEGETSLANGSLSIPLGENPADWKAILQQTRPIRVDFETPRLPLSKLHRFLPDTVRFPEDSTGQVLIDLSGTPENPILEASISILDVGLRSQPKIPLTDLSLEAKGANQTLKLEGEIFVPDYPKATLSAITSWTPKAWINDPNSATDAPLDAELRIANLNLAPFRQYLESAERLAGEINLVAQVTGKVSEPRPEAHLSLKGGHLEWKGSSIPDLEAIEVEIDVTPERALIEKLGMEIEAGTIALA
ncbi:MAG: hypothetical protein ACQKBU_05145, partial [Verrucomicrobiales bacterium]